MCEFIIIITDIETSTIKLCIIKSNCYIYLRAIKAKSCSRNSSLPIVYTVILGLEEGKFMWSGQRFVLPKCALLIVLHTCMSYIAFKYQLITIQALAVFMYQINRFTD